MYYYLCIGLILFLIGLLGSMFTKNIVKLLISIEIMLMGINVNFVTFGTFCDNVKFDGYVFALFYTAIGAIELAIALYIFYLIHRTSNGQK
jgi:NADH:ubiquinone oxidoreductase subunit K